MACQREALHAAMLCSAHLHLCVCDHTLLGGDWIFSLHLGHQWLDESMSESLILVGRSAKLHVHAHTLAFSHSQFEIQMYRFFLSGAASAGPRGSGPSSLSMGRFSLYSFLSDIPLSTLTLSLSQHTHHVPGDASRKTGCNSLEHKGMIMCFRA